jgi:MoxR-like ATPases
LTLRSVVEASRGVFIGREKEVKLLILALIAKEHFLMVSEPGTAKTMLAETARAFGYSTSYYLLTRDTTVTDVLADTLAVREHGGEGGGGEDFG